MSVSDLLEVQNFASLIGGTIIIFYVVWQVIEKAFGNVSWIKKWKEQREKAADDRIKEKVQNLVLTVLIPPILNEIESINKEQNEKLDKLLKSSNDTIRVELTRIYFKYRSYKKIPQWAKQSASNLYDDYVAQDGNTFIKGLWLQICEWEVVSNENDVYKDKREEI